MANTSSHSSSSRLDSADVTIPSGFKVGAVGVFATPWRDHSEGRFGPKDWSASVSGGVVHLRANTSSGGHIDTLQPGQAVTVFLWVVTPCLAANSSSWPTVAGSTPGGHDFSSTSTPSLRELGNCSFAFHVSSPQTAGTPISTTVQTLDGFGRPTSAYDGSATVTGNLSTSPGGNAPVYDTVNFVHGSSTGPLATPFTAERFRQLNVSSGAISGQSNFFDVVGGTPELDFVQQPTDTTVGTAIAPAITVDATDGFGNPTPLTAPVTLAIGTDGAGTGTTLGGTATETPVGNTATFSDITLGQDGSGFTLTASAAGFSAATSDPFDVTGPTINCPSGDSCGSNVSGDTTVIAPPGWSISFGPESEAINCGDFDGQHPVFGSVATFAPPADSDSDGTVDITFDYSGSLFTDPNGGRITPDGFCYSKTGDGYGVLQTCDPSNEVDFVGPPCVVDQGFVVPTNAAVGPFPIGDYVVTIEILADDPHGGLN